MHAFAALAATLLLTAGCAGQKEYSPADIRAEYEEQQTAGAAGPQPVPRAIDGSGFPLQLSTAIDTALANNPDLRQAAHKIARAEAMKKLSEAVFWPRAGLYTEYMQGDAPSSYLFKKIDQRRLPQNVNFNDPGWFENWESGLKAQMNLYNGGANRLESRMAKRAVRISALERQSVSNRLVSKTVSAYLDVLEARDYIDITEASVAAVAEQLRIMRVQYEGGGALKSDVLSLEVRLARAEEAVVESRNRLKLAKAGFGVLLGLDPAEMAAMENVVTPVSELPADVPETYEKGIGHALLHRPELEKAREALIRSRMKADAAKAAYLPRLDLMAKYYLDAPDPDYDLDRENWTAALMLNWEIFAGFSREARVDMADAGVLETLAVERKATLSVKQDVKSAYLNREAARARYRVARNSVESAEASFQLVREHYRGGAVTVTRYLEAELDRNRARTRATAAFYDRLEAEAEVCRAIGCWAERETKLSERQQTP
jgi:outer membrane protein TolC